jgi:RNA polymerase sigma-70 factor (ECF subfamily)
MSEENIDSIMVQAVLEGDTNAYQALVERYERRIYYVAYGMVRDQEDAREISQEAFVRAFRKIDTFRLESKFYTWLCRITINLCIDHHRRMKHRRTSEYDDSRTSGADSGVIELHTRRDNPSANVDRKHLRERIMAAFDQLPDDQRQVVVLRELEDFSYKEIAEILDIPEGTVMSRLYYARRKLQLLLKDDAP